MDDLNRSNDADDDRGQPKLDPTDDLYGIIKSTIARRDATGKEFDFDEILMEIEDKHPQALLRSGERLARAACRRLIADYVRRISGQSDEDDGPQLALPGLERVPSHTAYRVHIPGTNKTHVVARATAFATLRQHEACLELKQINSRRCIEREGVQQRIIDLLRRTGCDTLNEWQERHGTAAA